MENYDNYPFEEVTPRDFFQHPKKWHDIAAKMESINDMTMLIYIASHYAIYREELDTECFETDTDQTIWETFWLTEKPLLDKVWTKYINGCKARGISKPTMIGNQNWASNKADTKQNQSEDKAKHKAKSKLNTKQDFSSETKLNTKPLYNRENININNSKLEKEEYINNSFAQFWESYDKKVGKDKAYKKWRTLSDEERADILENVPKYIEATPEKAYRKDPVTYLNNRSWKDEIITKHPRAQSSPQGTPPNDTRLLDNDQHKFDGYESGSWERH